MNILQEIVAWKRLELQREKDQLPPRQLHAEVERLMEQPIHTRSMSSALTEAKTGIIAEFKRKSPSKGWINREAQPELVVPAYEQAGATAASILTDEHYFGGCREFVSRVRPLVDMPLLRKEFIIDEYQIFQARAIGADAILLIAADLTLQECRSLIRTAHELRLEVLLELHDEAELDYADSETDMIGINNRNLSTFVTNVQTSFRLADRLPKDKTLVSESGISQPQTVAALRTAGYRGFLMGEHFMQNRNPGQALQQFIAELPKVDDAP